MARQDEAFDLRVLVEHIGDGFREREAGNEIRHIGHAVAVQLARQRLAFRLIGQRQHRGGMRVVHEFVRQKGMQQCFH